MDNQTFQLRPRNYEEHLSTFGKKVLNALKQSWRADENSNEIAHANNIQAQKNNRVLSFRNDVSQQRARLTPSISNETHSEAQITESQNLVNSQHPISAQAPSISKLVPTVDNTKNITYNKPDLLSGNLINPVINGNDKLPKDFLICLSSADLLNSKGQSVNVSHINEEEKDNDIGWDDIFDTELLTNTTNIVDKVAQQSDNCVYNLNNTEQFPTAEPVGPLDIHEKITEKKSQSLTKTNKTNKRPKCKSTSNDNTKAKKVKKTSDEIKPNMPKRKYTKAIKNWLDDVHANNPAEKDDGIASNNVMKNTAVIIEKGKVGPSKKVIQSQLTNKGGKMKFDKPRKEVNDKDEIIVEPENHLVENTITDKINTNDKVSKEPTNKGKKGKPKFVAPIKSQIPINDVEYSVNVIANEDDIKSIVKLGSVINEDLIAVLVYSNGFCQLNNQHTEDSCNPEGVFIHVHEENFYFRGHDEFIGKHLEPLIENNKMICYEAKALLIYFKSIFDWDIDKIDAIDAKIGGSLLSPDSPPESFSDLQKLLSFTPQYTIATECTLQKTAWYSTQLRECAAKLVFSLKEEELWRVFEEIEMKLLPTIADMERVGITVDMQKLKQMEEVLKKKMKWTEQECYRAAGKRFQINSHAQVRAILYDELQLDTKSNIKIRETLTKGEKSTSEPMLRNLASAHALPRLILEYRHLHKAHATFLVGIAQFVRDGVVRPTWVQTAAATGRIASNNPNLQAIPSTPFKLVLFPEENGSGGAPYAGRGGRALLRADFRHVECRVAARAANDPALLAALAAHRDLFRVLAAEWLQKPETEVNDEERERTKRIVYASLYGAGCGTLGDILHVPYEQARDVLASFHRAFPSLRSFSRAAAGGRAVSLCGRARRLPLAPWQPRARRQALNFVVQGTAADLCKLAMIQCRRRLRAAAVDASLLLQIHDELVWEIPHAQLHVAARIIKNAMESCGLEYGFTVPLPVSIYIGKNWGEMTPYTVPE